MTMKSDLELYNDFAIKSLIAYWKRGGERLGDYLHCAVMWNKGAAGTNDLFFLQQIVAIKKTLGN